MREQILSNKFNYYKLNLKLINIQNKLSVNNYNTFEIVCNMEDINKNFIKTSENLRSNKYVVENSLDFLKKYSEYIKTYGNNICKSSLYSDIIVYNKGEGINSLSPISIVTESNVFDCYLLNIIIDEDKIILKVLQIEENIEKINSRVEHKHTKDLLHTHIIHESGNQGNIKNNNIICKNTTIIFIDIDFVDDEDPVLEEESLNDDEDEDDSNVLPNSKKNTINKIKTETNKIKKIVSDELNEVDIIFKNINERIEELNKEDITPNASQQKLSKVEKEEYKRMQKFLKENPKIKEYIDSIVNNENITKNFNTATEEIKKYNESFEKKTEEYEKDTNDNIDYFSENKTEKNFKNEEEKNKWIIEQNKKFGIAEEEKFDKFSDIMTQKYGKNWIEDVYSENYNEIVVKPINELNEKLKELFPDNSKENIQSYNTKFAEGDDKISEEWQTEKKKLFKLFDEKDKNVKFNKDFAVNKENFLEEFNEENREKINKYLELIKKIKRIYGEDWENESKIIKTKNKVMFAKEQNIQESEDYFVSNNIKLYYDDMTKYFEENPTIKDYVNSIINDKSVLNNFDTAFKELEVYNKKFEENETQYKEDLKNNIDYFSESKKVIKFKNIEEENKWIKKQNELFEKNKNNEIKIFKNKLLKDYGTNWLEDAYSEKYNEDFMKKNPKPTENEWNNEKKKFFKFFGEKDISEVKYNKDFINNKENFLEEFNEENREKINEYLKFINDQKYMDGDNWEELLLKNDGKDDSFEFATTLKEVANKEFFVEKSNVLNLSSEKLKKFIANNSLQYESEEQKIKIENKTDKFINNKLASSDLNIKFKALKEIFDRIKFPKGSITKQIIEYNTNTDTYTDEIINKIKDLQKDNWSKKNENYNTIKNFFENIKINNQDVDPLKKALNREVVFKSISTPKLSFIKKITYKFKQIKQFFFKNRNENIIELLFFYIKVDKDSKNISKSSIENIKLEYIDNINLIDLYSINNNSEELNYNNLQLKNFDKNIIEKYKDVSNYLYNYFVFYYYYYTEYINFKVELETILLFLKTNKKYNSILSKINFKSFFQSFVEDIYKNMKKYYETNSKNIDEKDQFMLYLNYLNKYLSGNNYQNYMKIRNNYEYAKKIALELSFYKIIRYKFDNKIETREEFIQDIFISSIKEYYYPIFVNVISKKLLYLLSEYNNFFDIIDINYSLILTRFINNFILIINYNYLINNNIKNPVKILTINDLLEYIQKNNKFIFPIYKTNSFLIQFNQILINKSDFLNKQVEEVNRENIKYLYLSIKKKYTNELNKNLEKITKSNNYLNSSIIYINNETKKYNNLKDKSKEKTEEVKNNISLSVNDIETNYKNLKKFVDITFNDTKNEINKISLNKLIEIYANVNTEKWEQYNTLLLISSDYILTIFSIININNLNSKHNTNIVHLDISELKKSLNLPDINKIEKSVKLEEVIKDNNDYKYYWIPNNNNFNSLNNYLLVLLNTENRIIYLGSYDI